MPTETKRPIWLGVLIAPLAEPVLFFLGLVVFSDASPLHFGELLVVSALTAPVSYLATVLVALPIALLLRAENLLSFWLFGLAGILFGSLVFLGLWFVTDAPWSGLLWSIGWGGALGLSVAVTFCLVVGITRRSSGPATPAA